MIKSWADHCSSDEEDSVADDHHDAELAAETADKLDVIDDPNSQQALPVSPDEIVPTDEAPVERVYDFPSQPPFTAFVGNLSYQIKDPPMLMEVVSNLAKDRLSETVNVLGGRIAYHRTDPHGKHRGFGYVEVESLDQLKLLMTLNDDKEATIAGRKVQLDTANHQNHNNNRRGSQGSRGSFQRGDSRGPNDGGVNNNGGFGNVDGSKFRGGKYSNQNRDNNKRRGSHRNSFQSSNSVQDAPSGPPAQRPSLKLAPRSKPVDNPEPLSSSASNIFGGATARDEQAWQQRRASMQKEQGAVKESQDKSEQEAAGAPEDAPKKPEHKNAAPTDGSGANSSRSSGQFQEQRQSGKGRNAGRGRAGGRGGGRHHDKGDDNTHNRRGSRRNSAQQDKKQQKQQTPEEKAAAAAAKVAAVAAVPQPAPKNGGIQQVRVAHGLRL